MGDQIKKNFLWGEGNGYFLKQRARLDTFIFDKMLKNTYLYSH